MADLALLAVFPALMIAAAVSDLFTMTIPNRIAIILTLGFFAFSLFLHLPLQSIEWHLASGGVVLAVSFVLFTTGWIGGGDAKLAAATALWLGFEQLADYLLISTMLGGALTLVILQIRKWPLPDYLMSHPSVARLHEKTNGVPYGIALAVAGLVLYPDSQIWLAGSV